MPIASSNRCITNKQLKSWGLDFYTLQELEFIEAKYTDKSGWQLIVYVEGFGELVSINELNLCSQIDNNIFQAFKRSHLFQNCQLILGDDGYIYEYDVVDREINRYNDDPIVSYQLDDFIIEYLEEIKMHSTIH